MGFIVLYFGDFWSAAFPNPDLHLWWSPIFDWVGNEESCACSEESCLIYPIWLSTWVNGIDLIPYQTPAHSVCRFCVSVLRLECSDSLSQLAVFLGRSGSPWLTDGGCVSYCCQMRSFSAYPTPCKVYWIMFASLFTSPTIILNKQPFCDAKCMYRISAHSLWVAKRVAARPWWMR